MAKKPRDIPDTFLNIAQAVQQFDISRSTLQRAIKTGKIGFRVSGDGKQDKYLDPTDLAKEYQIRPESDAP